MGSFVLNLDDIEGASFELMPKGDYVATVDAVEVQTSKAGDKMLLWKMTIIDGEYTGRKLPFFRCMLEGRGVVFTKPIFESFGITGEMELQFDEDGDAEILVEPDFVGATVIAKVGVEKYNDENQNTVKSLKAANAVVAATPPPSNGSSTVQRSAQPTARRFK